MRSTKTVPSKRAALLTTITLWMLGCAVPPSDSILSPSPYTDDERDALIQEAFDRAACVCEAQLLVDASVSVDSPVLAQRITTSAANAASDTRMARYATRFGGDARAVCSIAGLALPVRDIDGDDDIMTVADQEREIGQNGCVGAGSYQAGFCRADFNYCLAQQLGLRVDSLVSPLADVDARAELAREARRRFELAAVEASSTLYTVGTTCSTSSPHGDCAFRLRNPGPNYGLTVVQRVADGLSQASESVRSEVRMLLAQSDAERTSPAVGGPEATWGVESPRMRAASLLMGDAPLRTSRSPRTTSPGLVSITGGRDAGWVPSPGSPTANSLIPVNLYRERLDHPLAADLVLADGSRIRAGTRVNVYLLHARVSGYFVATPTITFDRPVLALIDSSSELAATDSTLGRVGTTYPTGARGMDAGFAAAIGNIVSVNIDPSTTGDVDQVRIIVPAETIPAAEVVVQPRAGDAPYALGEGATDARVPVVLGLIARMRAPLPHAVCARADTGETTASGWVSSLEAATTPPADGGPLADAPLAASAVYDQLALRVANGAGIADAPVDLAVARTRLLETYGLQVEHVRQAIVYLQDSPAVDLPYAFVLRDGLTASTGVQCGQSTLLAVGTSTEQRDPRVLASLMSAGAQGNPLHQGGLGPTPWSQPNYYAFDARQIDRVGASGVAAMVRHNLARIRERTDLLVASDPLVEEALRLSEALAGERWLEWRYCASSNGCNGDTPYSGHLALFARRDTTPLEGHPVLVTEADARCLMRGGEPNRPGAGCAHVASRQLPMTGGATLDVGPYRGRDYAVSGLRGATASDRRVVLWARCALSSGTCSDSVPSHWAYERIGAVQLAVGQVHPLDGELLALFGETIARNPESPVEPMFNALCIDPTEVPPLEHEIIDDGDARESSFAYYLTRATQAQVRASELLASARAEEISMLAYDEERAIQRDLAEQSERERLSELCGATGEDPQCPAVTTSSIMLGQLGIIPEAGPLRLSFDVALDQRVPRCAQLLADFRDWQPPDPNDYDADEYRERLGNDLRNALRCARFLTLTGASSVRIQQLPDAVRDEILRDGPGDFPEHDGLVREELIRTYASLRDLRLAFEGFESAFIQAENGVTNAVDAIDYEDGWMESLRELSCWVGGIAIGVGQIAMGGAALYAQAQAPISPTMVYGLGKAATEIGAGFQTLSRVGQGCDQDEDEDVAKRQARAAFIEVLGAIDGLSRYHHQAIGLISTVALADARLDTIARQAALAARRRAIEERLAASGVYGHPAWRALSGYHLRRARQAMTRAQILAHTARRAIELRFGVDMDTMTAPIDANVPPPASWANDVFAVDSAAILAADGSSVSVAAEALEEYLVRLSDFVVAYPAWHRFSEGRDTQILSLADALSVDPGDAGLESVVPAIWQLDFVCNDGARLLGGVDSLVGLDPLAPPRPCGAHGGVESVRATFAIPPGLGPYFGERLASGNYNYRIQSIAVNLVGNALADCSVAVRPRECYADGNVQYTLRHSGEVVVENWDHEQLTFQMEPGVIEHARALADESWLTNPLASFDAGRISAFERTEWFGRPLVGSFELRLHSRPEIDWTRLEDVQVLLRYGYWTRQVH